MADSALLARLDALFALLAFWTALSLVVASFAIMAFNPAVGLVSLATVVLAAVVSGYAFLRTTAEET